jgi:hypothetical protein
MKRKRREYWPEPVGLLVKWFVAQEAKRENMDKLETAYHEAGHAVVAYRFGHLAGSLTIVPDSATDILGSVETEGEWSDGSTDWEQIMVLFAGSAAQRFFTSSASRLGSGQDDEKAVRLLQFQPVGAMKKLRAKALAMIKKNWPQITAVATALVEAETLIYDEWTIVIDAVDEGEDWREILNRFRLMFCRPR